MLRTPKVRRSEDPRTKSRYGNPNQPLLLQAGRCGQRRDELCQITVFQLAESPVSLDGRDAACGPRDRADQYQAVMSFSVSTVLDP